MCGFGDAHDVFGVGARAVEDGSVGYGGDGGDVGDGHCDVKYMGIEGFMGDVGKEVGEEDGVDHLSATSGGVCRHAIGRCLRVYYDEV